MCYLPVSSSFKLLWFDLSKNAAADSDLKKAVLSEISQSRRRRTESTKNSKAAILDAIRLLEEDTKNTKTTIKSENVEGLWSLVYSTQETKGIDKSDRLVDAISARLYKIFFKIAPFLAGGQEKVMIQTTNRQNLDLRNGVVNNVVNVRLLPKLALEIHVDGTIRLMDEKTNFGDNGNPLLLEVIFNEFSVYIEVDNDKSRNSDSDSSNKDGRKRKKLVLPLPKPKGSLTTTFCDGDLRISRGGRGGIFVAKKI